MAAIFSCNGDQAHEIRSVNDLLEWHAFARHCIRVAACFWTYILAIFPAVQAFRGMRLGGRMSSEQIENWASTKVGRTCA
jgi:hypothetical protein